METCNSGPKVAILRAKTTDEGRVSWRLVILELVTVFFIHKPTGEAGDP